MESAETLDHMIRSVQHLDRERCKACLKTIKRPKLDFTEEFLDTLSLDRLHHILVAAFLQMGTRPSQKVMSEAGLAMG